MKDGAAAAPAVEGVAAVASCLRLTFDIVVVVVVVEVWLRRASRGGSLKLDRPQPDLSRRGFSSPEFLRFPLPFLPLALTLPPSPLLSCSVSQPVLLSPRLPRDQSPRSQVRSLSRFSLLRPSDQNPSHPPHVAPLLRLLQRPLHLLHSLSLSITRQLCAVAVEPTTHNFPIPADHAPSSSLSNRTPQSATLPTPPSRTSRSTTATHPSSPTPRTCSRSNAASTTASRTISSPAKRVSRRVPSSSDGVGRMTLLGGTVPVGRGGGGCDEE